MKTLLHFFDQMSNFTSNFGLKFWWWALETIIYRYLLNLFSKRLDQLAINKKWIEEIADYNWGKIVWFTGN